jgi:hypothetical protein
LSTLERDLPMANALKAFAPQRTQRSQRKRQKFFNPFFSLRNLRDLCGESSFLDPFALAFAARFAGKNRLH